MSRDSGAETLIAEGVAELTWEATRRDGTVSHIKYTVFTYSGDEITSGGAPHDFDGPLESEQKVTYGDAEWIVDHVDEEPDPPAVWLRPVSEGDLPV